MAVERSIVDRFWPKVQIGLGCWEWQGARLQAGYGSIGVAGKQVGAHRVAYEIAHGPIPEGLYICHHCDNPPCVRPSHLFAGTNSDNMKDAYAKGRAVRPETPRDYGGTHWTQQQPEDVLRGERHGRTRLSVEQVRELRRLHADGAGTLRELAPRFGLSYSGAQVIVSRKTWKHV